LDRRFPNFWNFFPEIDREQTASQHTIICNDLRGIPMSPDEFGNARRSSCPAVGWPRLLILITSLSAEIACERAAPTFFVDRLSANSLPFPYDIYHLMQNAGSGPLA
jgi:hypothetical protein